MPLAGESPSDSSPTEKASRREQRHTGSFCWRYGDRSDFFFKNYYGRRSRLTQFFHTCCFHPVNTIPALFPSPAAMWESWSHHSCDCSRPARPGTGWPASHPPQAGYVSSLQLTPTGGERGAQGAAGSLILTGQPGRRNRFTPSDRAVAVLGRHQASGLPRVVCTDSTHFQFGMCNSNGPRATTSVFSTIPLNKQLRTLGKSWNIGVQRTGASQAWCGHRTGASQAYSNWAGRPGLLLSLPMEKAT